MPTMTGTLFIVATPIGNLEDMTQRSIAILQAAACVYAEDTRVTGKLFQAFDIKTPRKTYHHHSAESVIVQIEERLQAGDDIALVSDAGTPGISDPGNKVVAAVSAHLPAVNIIAVPGASAMTAALSVSGFPTDTFQFLGFAPQKKRRQQFFDRINDSDMTSVFFESSHRIEKAMINMQETFEPNRYVCVCREITKVYESRYRGTIAQVAAMDMPAKGEFVIVVAPKAYVAL